MDLFSGLKSFLKINSTVIDNGIFRLHYKATAICLVAFSILVTARQYIGDPIDCMTKDDAVAKLLDTFCWVHATFSVESAFDKEVGVEVPYSGVGKYTPAEKRVYHAYYQWVCFVLFFQAILFYIPRYFWKSAEGNKIKSLILGLNSPVVPEETKETNRKLLVDYMVSNRNNHNLYFFKYAFAEILNFVNVVGQIVLIDVFLGNEFSTYGIKVVQFTGWDPAKRSDPMIRVFPRLTKCIFHKFGDGGSVETIDSMCVLPINVINEKIYVFLWFWLIILAILSGLVLIYRVIIIFLPKSRVFITRTRAPYSSLNYLETVVDQCKLGDWFVLDLLAKNLDPINFRDVVNDLARRLEGGKMLHGV